MELDAAVSAHYRCFFSSSTNTFTWGSAKASMHCRVLVEETREKNGPTPKDGSGSVFYFSAYCFS